jgi:hypothetical protein
MNNPTTPIAPAPAPAAPTSTQPAAPAVSDEIARLRAHAGLPPVPPGPEAPAAPAPSAGAPAAATPTAPTTAETDPKPTDPGRGGEPQKGDGALALELVREQRTRQAAEAKARELEEKLKLGATDLHPLQAAREKWGKGEFAAAIREAFGVRHFSDDLLVQLARSAAEPEPLSPEQERERIRQEIRDEIKRERDAADAQLAQLRDAAVEEVGGVLTKSPDKWPTVWRFGVTAEQLAAAMDASFDPRTGRTATAEQIFDQLEKEYRGNVEQLPYWQRPAEAPPPPAEPPTPAAPRSFGSESRRGPVPTTEPAKPQTAEQRWEARRKAEAEWRARVFASNRAT